MDLVIIYGSESVGKLTVARRLEEKTGFRLFHNHISIEVGRVLFEYGQDEYNDLIWQVRLLVFEAAAKHGVSGIIFTWAYSHPEFQRFRDMIYACLRDYDVNYRYVFLSCEQDELERRVVAEDRRLGGKAHTVDVLHKQQAAKNHVVIPGTDSLEIDNTAVPADEVADRIIQHYQLIDLGMKS